MKRKVFVRAGTVGLCIWLCLLIDDYWQPIPDPMQERFVAAKYAEAQRLAKSETNRVPSLVWTFFRAAKRNDYRSSTRIYDYLADSGYQRREKRSAVEQFLADALENAGFPEKQRSELDGLPLAAAVWEAQEALHLFRSPKSEWMRRLGDEIDATISTNGVFLSGTDAGHVAALYVNESAPNRKPFTAISVARLADNSYLEYLRQTAAEKVVIPTSQDLQNAFAEYMQAAQIRIQAGP